MMGKLSEREKWVVENMKPDGEFFNNEVSKVQFFSPFHHHQQQQQQQQKPPSLSRLVCLQSPDYSSSSSSSSSFSNGFCCSPEDASPFASTEREKKFVIMKNDGEFFNDVSDVPYFNIHHQHQQQNLLFNAGGRQSPECSSSLSSSGSLFSNGFSSTDNGSIYAPDQTKYQMPGSHYMSGLCFDSKSPGASFNGRSVDEMGLLQSFSGLSIKEEQNGATAKMKGFGVDGFGFDGFDDLSFDGDLGCNVNKYGGSHGGFNNNVAFDIEGFQSSPHSGISFGTSCDDGNHRFSGGFEKDSYVSMGSPLVALNQSADLHSASSWYNNQTDFLLENRGTWSNRGIQSQNSLFTAPYLNESSAFNQHCKTGSNGGRGIIDSLGAFHSINPKLDLNVYDPVYRGLIFREKMRAIKKNEYFMKSTGDMETFSCEDSYIIQGNVLNHVSNREGELFNSDKMNSLNEIPLRSLRGKSIKLDSCTLNGGMWENAQRISSYSPLSMVPSVSSLSEVQGNIYLMAQDQNGCRWLQRIFDEGTSQDVQIIFNEIIDHVIELMLKPFGNYVIQKFLDVCNEEQRTQIVSMVAAEPGQLLRICLNTYGTRAIQKLIETVKTRQQISSIVLALKPGFLDLVKDQNGNHVIQRCLQCLSNEDNKFIFYAAAKFCVQIATHRHGCCVMQRCVTHSTGKQRDKLIIEISKNALLLAQDPFGNYVVQYIVELKSPSVAVILLSQFKRHYVHLSMQKFSSHVVEKCLKHLEESREQIVHELISVSRFEQLLQDPFANYVIQSALAVTKGPLRSSLVAAVRPHVILRTNPYSKRIFSRNLLKK